LSTPPRTRRWRRQRAIRPPSARLRNRSARLRSWARL
jgi:hypothetical protein